MIRCIECGEALPDAAKFCSACGTPTTEASGWTKFAPRDEYVDPLTGLGSRRLIDERLDEIKNNARPEDSGWIALLDLDDVRGLNDQFGHEAVDQYLARLAEAFRLAVREDVTVARVGGDEFALLLDMPLDAARDHARLLQTEAAGVPGDVKTTLCVGMAGWIPSREAAEEALGRAARALRTAMMRGPGQIHIDGIDDPPAPDAPAAA